MRIPYSLPLLTLLVAIAGCDGSAPDVEEPGPDDPMPSGPAYVLVSTTESRVIGAGSSVVFHASAWSAENRLLGNAAFVWSSSDPLVAIVDSTGLVTTTGVGRTTLTASSAGVAGSAALEVLPTGVQYLSVLTAHDLLPEGIEAYQLDVVALDALRNPIAAEMDSVVWRSSDPSVVTVNLDGAVSAASPGTADVSAEVNDVSASTEIEVVSTTGFGDHTLDLELIALLRSMAPAGVVRPPTGMSVALVEDGRLVMARGYGLSGLPNDDPVEPGSLFRIASISKPLTAVTLLRLVDEGLLSLDDKLIEVAPSLIPDGGPADPRAAQIELNMLLEHRGGWDRSVDPNPLFILRTIADEMGVPSPPSRTAFAQWVFSRPLHYAPGTRYTYNNVNYLVLGEVIEAVTGMPFEEHVRSTVLAPIGATSLRVGGTLERDRQPGEVVYQYAGADQSVFDEEPGVLPRQYGGRFNLRLTEASGGWIGSAVDLARFGRAFRDGVLVSTESHDYMIADHSDSGVYGAGWVLDDDGINHSGLLEGSNSILSIRDDGRIIVLLFNGNTDRPFTDFIDQILAIPDWPDHDLFLVY